MLSLFSTDCESSGSKTPLPLGVKRQGIIRKAVDTCIGITFVTFLAPLNRYAFGPDDEYDDDALNDDRVINSWCRDLCR